MNINFELYRVFYEVVNSGSITGASKVLNISQPAISKSIKNLEHQLGGNLFIRNKKGVTLTEEGEVFYNYIKNAIEYINNAESSFSNLVNLETGSIRIGISTTLTENFFLPYLKEFHTKYPKVNIQIYTGIGDELIDKLRRGIIDIALIHLMDKEYGNDLSIKKIKKIHSCFVANKDYKELLNKEVSINEINKYPLILQLKGSNSREAIEKMAKDNNIVLNSSIELTSYTLISEFAKIGLGIGISTKEYIKEDLENKDLFELNVKEKIPDRYIGYVALKSSIPNFSTKKLIEIINEKK